MHLKKYVIYLKIMEVKEKKEKNDIPHFPRKGKMVPKAWGYELWIHNSEAYCGKLLVFKKDAKFSMHYHLLKEETWYVSSGSFYYHFIDTNEGKKYKIMIDEGDVIDLKQGQPHQLQATTEGSTIFEVSTQHFDEDSYRVLPGDSQK
jgi:mannose-6-phosphate isomerase-like protein (cupin superfamily)